MLARARGPRHRSHLSPDLSESPYPTNQGISPGFVAPGICTSKLVGQETLDPGFDDHDEHPKPIRWWPYRLLPAPHVLCRTLFPTLQGWGEKPVWDKIISLISVPSVLVLVATLPVVETEMESEHSDQDSIADVLGLDLRGTRPRRSQVERHASIEPETEWQEYRRRTRSSTARSAIDGNSVTSSWRSTRHGRPSPGLLPTHQSSVSLGHAPGQPKQVTRHQPGSFLDLW